MASKKKGQRKRKSAGLGDIFEVSDKDLSPEPENKDIAEPEAKVLRTWGSDVTESRQSIEQHDACDEVQNKKNNEIITENRENYTVSKERIDSIVISDTSMSEIDDVQIIEDSCEATLQSVSADYQESASNDEIKAKEVENVTTTSSNIFTANEKDLNDSCIEILTKEKSEEMLTVVDQVEGSFENEVITICDNSPDLSGEFEASSEPQNIREDTLEDGELNENTLGEADSRVFISSNSITIKFSNKLMADIYKPKFYKFIESFVELEVQNMDDTTISLVRDDNLDAKEWVIVDNTLCNDINEELAKPLPETPKTDNVKKKKKKKKQQQATELFVVDANPGIETPKHLTTKYSTKFLINDKAQEVDKNKISKPSFSGTCYNCEKDHSLKDCPHPKNYAKINATKQKFQAKNKARYHLEDNQKYHHLRPGKISAALRKALGLKKHQLPSYIYQMRLLGYPPGWLEEAKFVSSELTMFDIDGNNVKNTNSKQNRGLDPEKIIEYPGFNVSFGKEFKDEFNYHGVPPFCDTFGKQYMIETFKEMSKREEDDFETQDMDLDNANDSAEQDKVTDDKKVDFSTDIDLTCETSPLSLHELQKQKDSLLEEIKKSGETVPWEQVSKSTNQLSGDECKTENKSNEEKSSNSDCEIIDEDVIETKTGLETETAKSKEVKENSSPLNTSFVNCVKHSLFGTPILKSSSPYNRLPNADNFTKGVSQMIDFENLPNSTGKYEKMTGLLQKVRKTLTVLHKPKT